MKRILKIPMMLAGGLLVLLVETMSIRGQSQSYIVVDIKPLVIDGYDVTINNINNKGQLLGYLSPFSDFSATRAFLYENGEINDLGTLGADFSYASGFNENGEVVGCSATDSLRFRRAFLYSGGVMHDLGTMNGIESYAAAINNRGDVAGWIMGSLYMEGAFLYSQGSMRRIDTGNNSSYPMGINDVGQITGFNCINYNGVNYCWAFLYTDGSTVDLGTLGGSSRYAYGINNRGEVVGKAENVSSKFHAFLYKNGVMQDLGTLPGHTISGAKAINEKGQIVGFSHGETPMVNTSRGFLYIDGIMRNLNDLVVNTEWVIDNANDINDWGQIVAHGYNAQVEWRSLLLNPLPLGWREAIEKQPELPTYGDCPQKLPGKNSLILVTHGWIKLIDNPLTSTVWVDDMTIRIQQYLDNERLNNWQVIGHKWFEGARPIDPIPLSAAQKALNNGIQVGNEFGKCLASEGWTHIHLIGHSAGAALIQSCAEVIKSITPSTTVHCTFLDAFVGSDKAGIVNYGKGVDWADSYFSHDFLTGGEQWPFTEGPLDFAYNVEVTWIDDSLEGEPVYFSTSSGLQSCRQGISTHEWPHQFYVKTIPPSIQQGAEGFGFPLSKEGGGWNLAINAYHPGPNTLKVLGETTSASCNQSLYQTTPAVIDPVFYQSLPTVQSGIIQLFQNGFGATTHSPSWVATFVTLTNPVSRVSFDAQFVSTNGARGLLTVYWDTNVIGSLDETAVQSGLRRYMFKFPKALPNTSHVLGFRIDPFTNVQSSIIVTNVALGFSGVSAPFSLSVTTNRSGGLSVLELKGQSGFNYTVETSTNLIHWNNMAVLINTNGLVRFVDPESTNAPARFYRAVVPN